MRRLGATLKLTTAFGVIACVLAATAVSASAITIEPLNKAFTGSPGAEGATWELRSVVGSWTCTESSVAGKTNSTKTNFVNVTPSFNKCITRSFEGGKEIQVTYKNGECGETKIPWEVALTEKPAGYKGTIKTKCPGTFTFTGALAACKLKVNTEQTVKNGWEWKDSGTNSNLNFTNAEFKYTATLCPEAWGASGMIALVNPAAHPFFIEGIFAV